MVVGKERAMRILRENTPFQKIPDASRITGLSQHYLRSGCKAGNIPHVKSGSAYYINVPALLEQLGVPGMSAAPSEPLPCVVCVHAGQMDPQRCEL